MGQIIVQRNAIGTVSLGLFLGAIGAFVYSALDPAFGPIAIGSMLGGAVVAGSSVDGQNRPLMDTSKPATTGS